MSQPEAGDRPTAVITGASAGLGAELARVLAEQGYTVGLVARRADRLRAVLDECRRHSPSSVMWVEDLADPSAPARIAANALATFGVVDVVVNNAATPGVRHVSRLEADEVERVMGVNFMAPVRLTLALLPSMLERDRGTVVNVSSMGGRVGIPRESAYVASKFALCGWSESLALDLWKTGVRVRLIIPGAIDTEIWDRPGEEEAAYSGPKASAREAAVGIAASIDSDAFEHYVPEGPLESGHTMAQIVGHKTADIDTYFARSMEILFGSEPESTTGPS
jgi:short-subunit dehydrogenase